MKDKCKRCKHYDKTQVLTFTCTDECSKPKPIIEPIIGTVGALEIDKIVESNLLLPTTHGIDLDDAVAMIKRHGILPIPTNPLPVDEDLMSEKKASEHRDLHEKVLSDKPERIHGVLQPTKYTSVCFYCGNQETRHARQKEHAVQHFYDSGWKVRVGRMTCPECANSKDFSKMKKLGRK